MAISLSGNVSGLKINEIMYNPSQSESYNEWVELFSEGEVDLSEYSLCGKSFLAGYVERESEEVLNDEGLTIEEGSYVLITDGGSGTEVYSNFDVDDSIAVHVDAASLCGGLSNDGKTITLEKNGEVIHEVTYEDSADEGYSLEFIDGELVESRESGGTPGRENSEFVDYEELDEEVEEVEEPELVLEEVEVEEPEEIVEVIYPENSLDKIVLNSPKKEVEREEVRFVSNEERRRIFVTYGFTGFVVLLLVFLAWRRL